MEPQELLSGFFNAIAGDPRISITHIGVYAAILQYWKEHNYSNPICAYSYQIMPLAKISAAGTFHRVIRDLSAYGYLHYVPSFNKKKGSRIYLLAGGMNDASIINKNYITRI